jgi:signal transduction histidine kinase
MRLVGRLSRQVVLTSVVTGVIGAAVVLLQVSTTLRRAIGATVRGIYLEREAARCRASPETWRFEGPGDLEAWAYDGEGQSANPRAPPYSRYGAAPVLRGADFGESVGELPGGAATFRVAADGPCAIIVTRWTSRFASGEAVSLLVTSGVVTVLAGAAVGLLFVVWPLARRTRHLRDATSALGATVGPQPVADGDELDLALARLREADARIRRDAATLTERSTALRRHLGEVAHDVRTPLSALQLALEQALESGDATTRPLLARALSECVFIANVTENLRLKSLVEDGVTPTPRALDDVSALVERVVVRARLLAAYRGVSVEMARPDAPVAAVVDEVFLERCLSNLVDNAARHASAEGHVAVLVSQREGRFEVVVRDDGVGVTPEVLARLGERHFRTDEARQRDPRGSGLGLGITSALCDRCGWRLAFAALEPHGFEVTLSGSTGAQHPAATVGA